MIQKVIRRNDQLHINTRKPSILKVGLESRDIEPEDSASAAGLFWVVGQFESAEGPVRLPKYIVRIEMPLVRLADYTDKAPDEVL